MANSVLFRNVPSTVGMLLGDVKSGKIGLPDLQRPFVWRDAKVRDLLDSMMKGYPIGYIMLWDAPTNYENASHVGLENKIYDRPKDLVIDGQQRLTGLLAAMYGVKITDKNYKERYIKISYNPLTKEFAVWSQAYERNPEWISVISDAFNADKDHKISKFRKEYLNKLNESREKNGEPELSDEEEYLVEENLGALLDLENYSLPTMEILNPADEEDVADIFVRVNSGGQKLNEKNFIETLLSVYDNEVHDKINKFCAESRIPADGTSFNHILKADPSHLIRMAVGVGFKRARLRYAYMLMRGKDLQKGAGGTITEESREQNLAIFKNALDVVVNLNNWHTFMNIFAGAGYLSEKFVASTNAVVYSYVLYLIGRYEYKVSPVVLQNVMKRWIFMSTITYFYTGSTESEVEKQFADLREIHTAEEFVDYLDATIKAAFTDDYFKYTLPKELVTSSTQSPVWYGYIAALNVLGTPMLFSTTPLSQYLVVGANGTKKSVDVHHIFPKNHLAQIGYDNDRDRNQIANYTFLDYQTNIDVSDNPPEDYVSVFREKLGEEKYLLTCEQNALPRDFEKMEYMDFLQERRKLMAGVILRAYRELSKS